MSNLEDYGLSPEEIASFKEEQKNRRGCIMNIKKVFKKLPMNEQTLWFASPPTPPLRHPCLVQCPAMICIQFTNPFFYCIKLQ